MNHIIGAFKTIGAAWQVFWWLRCEKKQMENDVDAYLSEERAAHWRLALEKIFRALEKGDTKKLPSLAKWLFASTTVDNRVGWFGLRLLKSKNLAERATCLDGPIQPYRAQ